MTEQKTARMEQIKKWYRGLPDKKRYLEFVTALLTIPVLLTVLINNTYNLQNQHKIVASPAPTIPAASKSPVNNPTPTIIFVPVSTPSSPLVASPSPAKECVKGVGPVAISYPDENDLISSNPVCIDITRQSSDYCAVVWSYRINDEAWSDFLDKSICMYGLTPGVKKLQVKIHSVANNDEVILDRSFIVAGATPTPTATTSAHLSP